MRIGRFFSLQNGRVGQYLSQRVLVVRTPFQKVTAMGEAEEVCYFGFPKLLQAQKFTHYLASLGYRFQLRKTQFLKPFAYEIKLWGHADLAKVLAYWDRLDQKQAIAASTQSKAQAGAPKVLSQVADPVANSLGAIAA